MFVNIVRGKDINGVEGHNHYIECDGVTVCAVMLKDTCKVDDDVMDVVVTQKGESTVYELEKWKDMVFVMNDAGETIQKYVWRK